VKGGDVRCLEATELGLPRELEVQERDREVGLAGLLERALVQRLVERRVVADITLIPTGAPLIFRGAPVGGS